MKNAMNHDNTAAPAPAQNLIARLRAEWGSAIVTDPAELEYFSTDVYSQGQPLLAVLRPSDATQLAAAVKQLTDAGVAVVPRGGGMSYTGGYIAAAIALLLYPFAPWEGDAVLRFVGDAELRGGVLPASRIRFYRLAAPPRDMGPAP